MQMKRIKNQKKVTRNRSSNDSIFAASLAEVRPSGEIDMVSIKSRKEAGTLLDSAGARMSIAREE